MNIIRIHLLAKLKPLAPPTCVICGGTGTVKRPWKKNSEWVLVDVPCKCQKGQAQ